MNTAYIFSIMQNERRLFLEMRTDIVEAQCKPIAERLADTHDRTITVESVDITGCARLIGSAHWTTGIGCMFRFSNECPRCRLRDCVCGPEQE